MSVHVIDRLSAYLDDELPRIERAEVAQHVEACPECARYAAELAAIDEAARGLPVEAPPGYFDSFPSRVRDRLAARPRRVWRPPVWTWAAAAAVLVAAVTPWLLRDASRPAAEPSSQRLETYARPTPVPQIVEGLRDRADQPVPKPPLAAPAARPERGAVEQRANGGRLAESTTDLAQEPAPEERRGAPTESRGFAAPAPAGPGGQRQAQAPLEPPATPGPAVAAQARPSPKPKTAREEAVTGALGQADAQAPQARAKDPEVNRVVTVTGAAPAVASKEKDDYRILSSRVPRTTREARDLREAWRALSQRLTSGPDADEARVRVVETGAHAYRLGHDPRDLQSMRRDAEAYLARSDAGQTERVRGLLRAVETP